jgi:hypothetical protein
LLSVLVEQLLETALLAVRVVHHLLVCLERQQAVAEAVLILRVVQLVVQAAVSRLAVLVVQETKVDIHPQKVLMEAVQARVRLLVMLVVAEAVLG